MLHKTRGIVLSHIKYKETSIITKIYTESFGIQSYIQNGVRSLNAKSKIAYFQPLNLLEMVVYHKKEAEIQRISEMKLAYVYREIHTQISKISVVSFLTEMLTKSLKEEAKSEQMFDFLFESLIIFDHVSSSEFHLKFLLKFGQHLGFMPHSADEYLITANFIYPALSKTYENTEFYNWLCIIYKMDYAINQAITTKFRAIFLDSILAMYAHYLDFKSPIKSVEIIREL